MAMVAAIQYDRMIMEKKKQKEISDVENQQHEARIRNQADADFYLIQKQAESNKVLCLCVWHKIIIIMIRIRINLVCPPQQLKL